MSQNIEVQNVKGVQNQNEVDQSHLNPGALTGYEDGAWVFTGNGQTTPTQVLQRIIEVESEHEAELQPFRGSQDAARFAALQNLRKAYNQHLDMSGPDAAVPKNEQLNVEGGKSLKQLLAPFKNNIATLRQAVANMAGQNSGMAPRNNAVTGNVRSQGLALPID